MTRTRRTYFAATLASGFDVTGAPASSSGATKLNSSRSSLPRGTSGSSYTYDVTEQFATSFSRSILRISVFGHVLEQVTHAENDDRMADEEHTLAAVLARYHLGCAAQPENHVAPALTTRRTMIEFAEQFAEFRLVGVIGFDADSRESVENPEFLFPKSLVYDEGELCRAGSPADFATISAVCRARTIGRSAG